MWEIVKNKITKLGCFVLIGLCVLVATSITKVVLSWLHHGDADKEVIAGQVGEYLGKGILLLVFVVGLTFMWREYVQGKKSKASHFPSLPMPPSLANGTKQPKFTTRGCIIAIVGLPLLIITMAIGGCWWMAEQYDKRPKEPGEWELMAIKEDTMSYKGSEGFGNNETSRKLAADFARLLRTLRQAVFSDGDPNSVSLSKGYFITYCNNNDGLCAFIVHVPEFRHYTKDAQITMSELAWKAAVTTLGEAHVDPKELAVGVRGFMDFTSILIGKPSSPDSLGGIEQRYDGLEEKQLFRFFIDAPPPFTKKAAGKPLTTSEAQPEDQLVDSIRARLAHQAMIELGFPTISHTSGTPRPWALRGPDRHARCSRR